MEKNHCDRVTFLLVPEYSMIALMSAVETLRIANRLNGSRFLEWELVSEQGGAIAASNGMTLMCDAALDEVPPERVTNLFVCSSFNPERYYSKRLLGWLKQLNRQGVPLGAMCTGSYLLAQAGLLDGYRATVHWEAVPAFREAFPRVEVTEEIFEIDHQRYTCAGGTSSLDLMLHLIQLRYSRELALGVCEQFIHQRIRDHSDSPRLKVATRLGLNHSKLVKMVETMQENLDEPRSLKELADIGHVSVRQMERLFKAHLRETPRTYYLNLRLERARHLLQQSELSLIEIATACGFTSLSHFSRVYKHLHGQVPSKDRVVQSGS